MDKEEGMKSMRLKSIAVLCVLAISGAIVQAWAEGAAAAPDDGAWLGLFSEGAPASTADTQALEQKLGKRFASLMWFADFSLPFPAEAAENAWAAGSIPNVTWEPWFWAENNRIHLADINAGSWDGYITEWGQAAAKFGKTIFVRWGHEFNGDWYPWGIAKNGQDPQKYINAFRRVHDLVVRAGAKNVVWVWCPNASSVPSTDWNDPLLAYPGDAYVDWIAIDGYDFESNASFADIFSKTYDELVRKIDKPIYIGEFATGRVGAEKAAWLKEMHASLASQFRGIKGLVYFNIKKERDWRLDESPESLAGAKEVFSLPFYKSQPEAVAALAGAFHKNYAAYKKGLAPVSSADRKGFDAKRLTRDSSGKADWSGASAAEVSGKNGLSGKVKFGWDAERLYIRAEIKDKYPLTNGQKNDGIWNGDCLEVCISTDPKADPARTKFTSTDWQIGFAPEDQAKGLPARSWEWSKLRSAVPGAEVSSAPMDGGYTLEASLPWTALKGFAAKEGMVLGFDFAVDDAGANGQRSFQWIWNGSNQFYNSPVQWGTLTLLP
jgi:hypothetical protein